MSDSLWPHGLYPPGPSVHGDSPGKNSGVGLPFPSQADLSNPGIKPMSPAWQVDSLPPSHLGSPKDTNYPPPSLLTPKSLAHIYNSLSFDFHLLNSAAFSHFLFFDQLAILHKIRWWPYFLLETLYFLNLHASPCLHTPTPTPQFPIDNLLMSHAASQAAFLALSLLLSMISKLDIFPI